MVLARTLCVVAIAGVSLLACGGGTNNASDTSQPSPARTDANLSAVRDSSNGADSVSDRVAARDSARAVDSIVAAIRACPRDGSWHECSLERRLQMSGFRTVREDSAARIPGISKDGTLWRLGRQSVRVVFFESASAVELAMQALDSARAAPRGDTSAVWPDRPTLIRSANALAVLVGGSDRTVERIVNAITAGPPQPDRATP